MRGVRSSVRGCREAFCAALMVSLSGPVLADPVAAENHDSLLLFGASTDEVVSPEGDRPRPPPRASSADGAAWWTGFAAAPIGEGAGGAVNALLASGGSLWVGGDFVQVGSDAGAHRVARWSGSAWTRAGGGVNHRVFALIEFQGRVVAGGTFYHAGDVFANYVAEWTGTAWRALGAGPPGPVYALEVYQGRLIAGGSFGVRQWDGAVWSDLGAGVNGVVAALEVHAGRLVAGGIFPSAGGVLYTTNVARWNGTTWAGLDAGTNGAVTALYSRHDSLFVGGAFTAVADTVGSRVVPLPASRIAIYDETPPTPATKWVTTAFGAGASGTVFVIAEHGGRLVLGGAFDTVGGALAARRIATWDGVAWGTLGAGMAGTSVSPDVRAIASFGGDLYAGGWFTSAGGSPSRFLARWVDAPPTEPLAVARGAVPPARTGIVASPNPSHGPTRFAVATSARGAVDLAIFDARGRVIRRLAGVATGSTPLELSWDGRTEDGAAVPSGVYFVRSLGDGPVRDAARVVVTR